MSGRGWLPTIRGSFVPRYEFGKSLKGFVGGGWETSRGLMVLEPQAS